MGWLRLGNIAVAFLIANAAYSGFAMESGLKWLAAHQEADGHWDSVKYSGSLRADTAATSLALFAFLGAGHSEKVGDYKDNVKRAVAWLKSKQSADGRIFDSADDAQSSRDVCGSAISVEAISEAAALANVADTHTAAQKAVDHLVQSFPFVNGLDANNEPTWTIDKKADTVVIGWMVRAIKSAKVAGLKVPRPAMEALVSHLDSIEHRLGKGADTEFAPAADYWFRQDEKLNKDHPAYRVTATACLCRQFLGWKKEDVQASEEHFIEQGGVPVSNPSEDKADFLYWAIGTDCAFQQGGDIWSRWNEALQASLRYSRHKDGDDGGSWFVQDYASKEWGRVGATALACMCFEHYYIYQRFEP